jgi:hypothetical protein
VEPRLLSGDLLDDHQGLQEAAKAKSPVKAE